MAYTDKEIVDEVKSWNFGFICVNSNSGYARSRRIIKVQHLISKEIITCQYQIAKENQVRFPKYENLKIKNKLNSLKYGWICLDTWIIKKKSYHRVVKLQHLVSKEIITCNCQSAKKNLVRFPKYYSEQENLNFKNKLNSLKYRWVCLETYIQKKTRMAKLQHSVSKEVIVCQYQHAKKDVVRFTKYEDMKRFGSINKLGLKTNPQYICVSSNSGKSKGGHCLVSIKRKDGFGGIKTLPYSFLQQGGSPYNENKNRVEINKVHPQYKRMFKKLGLKFETMKLGKGSVIDFKVYHSSLKDKNIVIETKQSCKFYFYSKEQKSRYTRLANLKQYNIHKIYFSDPKGSHENHGFISIHELEKKLKKDFNLK